MTPIWTKNKGPVSTLKPNNADPPKVQNNQNPSVLKPANLLMTLLPIYQDKKIVIAIPNCQKIASINLNYHKNVWHSSGTLFIKFVPFQFKLFANNGTKFGAPGNRTPPLSYLSLFANIM